MQILISARALCRLSKCWSKHKKRSWRLCDGLGFEVVVVWLGLLQVTDRLWFIYCCLIALRFIVWKCRVWWGSSSRKMRMQQRGAQFVYCNVMFNSKSFGEVPTCFAHIVKIKQIFPPVEGLISRYISDGWCKWCAECNRCQEVTLLMKWLASVLGRHSTHVQTFMTIQRNTFNFIYCYLKAPEFLRAEYYSFTIFPSNLKCVLSRAGNLKQGFKACVSRLVSWSYNSSGHPKLMSTLFFSGILAIFR